jgi:hypothetical protein
MVNKKNPFFYSSSNQLRPCDLLNKLLVWFNPPSRFNMSNLSSIEIYVFPFSEYKFKF